MSGVALYRGIHGETVSIPADRLSRRTQFPVAEFADRLGGEADRKELGTLSSKRPYAEVLAFMDKQKRRASGIHGQAEAPRY